jgi:Zn-dependent membrane protease YugP
MFKKHVLKSKFKKYSKIGLSNGLTGKQIAEKMLYDNGIKDVEVISTPGRLTDHYNPKDKTINLSEDVYNSNSVAAAAVAAHECGHAVQHATAYNWLELRSAMVPIVSFSSKALGYVFMAMLFGFGVLNIFGSIDVVFYIIIALQSAVTIFTLVTLPVEYDASNRALVWLQSSHTANSNEHKIAKDLGAFSNKRTNQLWIGNTGSNIAQPITNVRNKGFWISKLR